MSVHVRLFTRSGCHLCEQAARDLGRLAATHPHTLELVDISDDEALAQRYGERIPVVHIDQAEYAAPLPYALLERALVEASRQAHGT